MGENAQQWIARGDQAWRGNFFTRMCSSAEERADAALECYARAATQLKIERRAPEAGLLYERMVDVCQQHPGLAHRQTEFLRDAAKCYQSASTATQDEQQLRDACRVYEELAKLQQEQGQLRAAGNEWREIAMMLQRSPALEVDTKTKAVQCWDKAQQLFEADGAMASAIAAMQARGTLLASQGEYERAHRVFGEAAEKCLSSDMTTVTASDCFYRALLTYLAFAAAQHQQDVGAAAADLADRYLDMLPRLSNSREFAMLQRVIQAVQADDVDAFTDALRRYDSVHAMTSWETNLLLAAKRGFWDESASALARLDSKPNETSDAFSGDVLSQLAGESKL